METAAEQKRGYRAAGFAARHSKAMLAVGSILYFAALFFAYFACRSRMPFTDEIEVFVGGAAVLHDPGVYIAPVSQHMPVSYYIAAVPAMLGARTLDQYRIIIGFMMCAVWTGNMLHNRKHIPLPVLLLVPFIYLYQTVFVGGYLQSDHWQGIGFVILVYEVFRYKQDTKLAIPSACWISFGIVLSFGSSIISAYTLLTVFIAALAILFIHLHRVNRNKDEDSACRRRTLIFHFVRMIVICIIPFVLLAVVYLIKGKFDAFVEGAYFINVRYYLKYAGGSENNPLITFLDIFRNYGLDIRDTISDLIHGNFAPIIVLAAIRHFCVILFTVKLATEKKFCLAAAFLLIFITSAARGFDSPHSMPMLCVASVAIAWCVNDFVLFFATKRKKLREYKPFKIVVHICAGLCVLASFAIIFVPLTERIFINAPGILKAYNNPKEIKTATVLNALYQPGDKVEVLSSVNPEVGMITLQSKAPPDMYSGAASTPWTYDCYGKRQLEALKKGTRFVLYIPGQYVWGYDLDEHMPEMVDYVNKHYSRLYGCLYVPNEEYEEAKKKLPDSGFADEWFNILI